MDRDQRIGVFFITISVIAYSFTPIFSKNILNQDFPALDLTIWRFIIATPLIWLIIQARNRLQPAARTEKMPYRRLLALGIPLTGAAVFSVMSLEHITASTFIVLFFTYPAMVAVISTFFGEKLQVKEWIALGLTLIGVILTAPDFIKNLGGEALSNFALVFLSAAFVAVYFLLNKPIVRGVKDMPLATAWVITGSCLPLILTIPVRQLQVPDSTEIWLSLIGLAVIGTVVSMFTLIIGIDKLGASRAAIISTAEMPSSVILAVLFLGEVMMPIQVVGATLVLLSIVLINTKITFRRSSLQRAVPESAAD